MARKRSKLLSERELQVMQAVWKLKRASVREIQLEMGNTAGAYTTVSTILKFLEDKGILRHVQVGKTYYYMPNRTKREEQARALSYIVNSFFDGDANLLIEHVCDHFEMEHS